MTDGGLKNILENKNICKLIHDCRNDSQALKYQHDIHLENVLDSQIAFGEITGESHRAGLNVVLKKFQQPVNVLKGVINHHYWNQRPLLNKYLSYAAQDVLSLIKSYEMIKNELTELNKYNTVLILSKSALENIVDEKIVLTKIFPGALPPNILMDVEKYLSFDMINNYKPTIHDTKVEESKFLIPHDLENELLFSKEYDLFLNLLPLDIKEKLFNLNYTNDVIEFVMDLGRAPLVRYFYKDEFNNNKKINNDVLKCRTVTFDDIEYVKNSENLGSFSSDNRAGINNTLHRISRKLNRFDEMIGITMRVGRMIQGSTHLISDIINQKRSVLLVGFPGVGKTTLLREYARVLSENNCRVEIVDTSNEIAGDSDIPHRSIGNARRMMVTDRNLQHKVMIEAVQNHTPECIIIDEIGNKLEAKAAADISQRGVQLVGTAHGTSLQTLLDNPELNLLLGGVHTVILSAEEARIQKTPTKTVRQRMGPPVFHTIIELKKQSEWIIYHNITEAVDLLLADKKPEYEIRYIDENDDNTMKVKKSNTHDYNN